MYSYKDQENCSFRTPKSLVKANSTPNTEKAATNETGHNLPLSYTSSNLFAEDSNFTVSPNSIRGGSMGRGCKLTDWTEWSACSLTCGPPRVVGHQTRKRSRFGSKMCATEPEAETRPCPRLNNCPTDCKISAWTEWTDCSRVIFCDMALGARDYWISLRFTKAQHCFRGWLGKSKAMVFLRKWKLWFLGGGGFFEE